MDSVAIRPPGIARVIQWRDRERSLGGLAPEAILSVNILYNLCVEVIQEES